MTEPDRPDAGGRRIAGLALPALGVLAAEPLYLLFDTAVVGRLGALSLAGLAIGGLLLSLVGSDLTFLSYGTTARSARHFGAGNRSSAVTEGVQATWLALGLGALVVIAVQAAAVPLVSVIAGGKVGGEAIAAAALLCPLLVYGWLGLPRLGLAGSAVANLAGQWLAAVLFGRALLAERAPLRLDRAVLRAQLVMGRDLVVRTLAFQACFVSAGAVAARFGASALAAHQVVLQLWEFLALVLDSLAIAAQALVGAALGAGDAAHAKSVARRVTLFSAAAAALLAAVCAVGFSALPRLFTDDRSVLAAIGVPWWFLVAQLPFAGIVFALDGVLLGAGDAAFMRTATVISALVGFLPLIWLSLVFGWGLAGIWTGLTTFVLLRLVFVGARAISGRWAATTGR